jgi:hypothetical protein
VWRQNVGIPGGLAPLDDGSIIFKQTVPSPDIDPSEIETVLRLVVEYGDYLEEQFTGEDKS